MGVAELGDGSCRTKSIKRGTDRYECPPSYTDGGGWVIRIRLLQNSELSMWRRGLEVGQIAMRDGRGAPHFSSLSIRRVEGEEDGGSGDTCQDDRIR